MIDDLQRTPNPLVRALQIPGRLGLAARYALLGARRRRPDEIKCASELGVIEGEDVCADRCFERGIVIQGNHFTHMGSKRGPNRPAP